MPEYTGSYIEIADLSKGLNTFDPPGKVPVGFYVDAQNMMLTNKSPKTVGGLTKLTASPCPKNETIVWAEPYTTTDGVTELLVISDAGTVYRYVIEDDDWETIWQGLTATATVYTHVPFRGQMIFSNGTDPIMKYDGTNCLPVGGLFVANMETSEHWTGTFTRPSQTNPRLRRVGLSAVFIRSGRNAVVTFQEAGVDTIQDFLTGLNGAPDFGATDKFKIHIYKDPKKPNGVVRIRFRGATATNYFQFQHTVVHDGWDIIEFNRSDATSNGTPNWNAIETMQILVVSGQEFGFDQCWFEYLLAPPVGSLVELYNQQLMVSGIAEDRVKMVYSDAGTPDYFPADNVARFSGGRNALEKTDQITALRSYFDELIVGKVNSAWTFSGTGTNVSISALPLTIGIDGHRLIAETPWSLQYPFENNIFGARLTSRGLVSTNVNSLLEDLDGDNLDKGVAIRHDRTHTIRWSFRTLDATDEQNDLGLIYDYQLDAWASTYSPKVAYYTRGIVDGRREVLAVQYDGYVRRADVGTDFDGTAIESWVTLPYMQSPAAESKSNVVRWIDATVYVKGGADVIVEARFADEPHQFETGSFTEFGRVLATPDGDKGYVSIGRTARWIQLRLRAEALDFEVCLPIVIGYSDTKRRV
jgi:hypothetical protein